jgi:hypothetical protein
MYFPSKHDVGLGIIIWGIILFGTVPAVIKTGRIELVIMILVVIFIAWVWFGTGYEIADNQLKISCGPFKLTVPLSEITEIRRTRSPLSSPACSLDRMEIRYGKSKRVMISPGDQENFIKTIVKGFPQISLDEGLRKYTD